MKLFSLVIVLLSNAGILFIKGECRNGLFGHVSTTLYDYLNCKYVEEHSLQSKSCWIKYDCSNIYHRPVNTCHFKGKTLSVEQRIDDEYLTDVWDSPCTCTVNLDFKCETPLDGCVIDWFGLEPGCYRSYELNQYCDGSKCPPFDNNAKCEVSGTPYKEGEKFDHPEKKCTKCVCNKGFTLEEPFCQKVNCTFAELYHSKQINDYCAPFYDHEEDACCPSSWICPSQNGNFHKDASEDHADFSDFQCNFGNEIMALGDYYTYEDKKLGKVHCSCIVPPLLYCTKQI